MVVNTKAQENIFRIFRNRMTLYHINKIHAKIKLRTNNKNALF